MKKILVRADDLGYSEGVNYGIAKSVIDGIVGSVGVMTNMPAVEHGLALLQGVDVCYGQHTNICVGKPLTDPKLIPSITNEFGEFKSSREYRNAVEDFVVLEEVMLEIEAQYHRFVELTGKQPQYFEGHAVASVNFFKGLELVAKKYDLPYVSLSFEKREAPFNNSLIHMWLESMEPTYDPTETIKMIVNNAREGVCDVLVLHPGYLDAFILKNSSLTTPRAFEVEMACDPKVKAWLSKQDVELVTYSDL